MPSTPICTQSQFELLHTQVNETREGTKYIKVDRQALVNLLEDHATLIRIAPKEQWNENGRKD